MKQSPYIGKVVRIAVYKNDVIVIREGSAPKMDEITRGEITEFSRKARQRLAFIAANTSIRFRTMITLTYPNVFESDGKEVKRHLREFLAWLRKDLGKHSYLWFLEFQRRGAPHIHLLLSTTFPRSQKNRSALYFRVSSNWYTIVGSKDPKHLAAGTRVEAIRKIDGGARYAVKEACKMYQKQVPPGYRNVGRFYGYSRDVVPVMEGETQCTEDDVRGVLEGWKYAPREDRTLYQCIYGQADRFRRYLPDSGDRGDRQGDLNLD